MLDFGGLLTIALFGFWVYSIIDVLLSDATEVRSLTKWAWLAIVALVFPLFPIGGALWFGLARPARSYRGQTLGEARDRFAARSRPSPRWGRPQPVDQTVDEAVIRARIEERDRLLAKWAEEEQRRKTDQPGPADEPGA